MSESSASAAPAPQSAGVAAAVSSEADKIQHIALDLIDPDPENHRKTIDQDKLQKLADSIGSAGLKQPITVRTHPDDPARFMIVMGHRRALACRSLGLPTIRAIVDNSPDHRIAQQIENIQRDDVTPIEEAIGIARLVERDDIPKEDLAKRLGVDPSHISRCLKIKGMGEDTIDKLMRRSISFQALYELAQCPLEVRVKLLKQDDAKLTSSNIKAARSSKGKPAATREGRGRPPLSAAQRFAKISADLDAILASIESDPALLDDGDLRRSLTALSDRLKSITGSAPSDVRGEAA